MQSGFLKYPFALNLKISLATGDMLSFLTIRAKKNNFLMCEGKLRVMRVASYFELRVVYFSLTSLSCHHIIFYRLAWMQLPVHLGKMDSVSDKERDDFLLRSQFKRYVMYVYSLWYSF